MEKTQTSFKVRNDILTSLKEDAIKQQRTLTNMLEVILSKHYKL